MRRSLESSSRSRNMDMSGDPEGIVGYADKTENFTEHMMDREELEEWIRRATARRDRDKERNDEKRQQYIQEAREKVMRAFRGESDIDGDERITSCKNRVFKSEFGPKYDDNPNVFRTDEKSVYRITGMGQIADIINCGYVRPKEGKLKGGHENEVFWSAGGDNLNFIDERPILETSADTIKDGQIGAIKLNDLTAVWVFNSESGKRENKLAQIMAIKSLQKKDEQIDAESLNEKMKKEITLADISETF